MDARSFEAKLKTDGVDYILAQWVDIHGTPRCKGVPASAAKMLLEGSAGFAGAAAVGLGQGPHDHDLIGVPDLATYTLVPWEQGVARVACDIQVDGAEWPFCSRTTLRTALARLRTLGYELKVGVEAEHMLVTRAADGTIAPYDPTGTDTMTKPCYDFKSLSANLGYLRTLVGYMEGLGWEPYATDHEDATAQFELNWKYADALTTADRAELIAGTAALRSEIDALARDTTVSALLPDVEIFHKAVAWSLADDTFYSPKEIAFAKHLLAEGRERAAQLRARKFPWLEARGLIVRGYRSKLDGSVQPYGLVVPADVDLSKPTPVMVWLLGRGEKRTELAFLSERESGPPQLTPKGVITLIPYGRFCNATKFAGEVDVMEALALAGEEARHPGRVVGGHDELHLGLPHR